MSYAPSWFYLKDYTGMHGQRVAVPKSTVLEVMNQSPEFVIRPRFKSAHLLLF